MLYPAELQAQDLANFSFLKGLEEMHGAPGESRTPDLLVRSQTLYPTELRAHTGSLLRNHC